MKSYKTILSVISVSVVSMMASADDDPLNCRTEYIGPKTVYYGTASCTAYGDGERHTISQNFTSSFTSLVTVMQSVPNVGLLQCPGRLTLSRVEDIYDEVCDYTPKASVIADAFSYGEVFVSASGSDRDGTITSIKLLIDGVEQGQTSMTLNAFNGPYSLGQQIKVQSVVTDNSGYTSTRTKYVTFRDDIGLNPF